MRSQSWSRRPHGVGNSLTAKVFQDTACFQELACSKYLIDPAQTSSRILGSGKSSRDGEHWFEQEIVNPRAMCATRIAQGATRSPSGRWLGFARGSGVDCFNLEPVGSL